MDNQTKLKLIQINMEAAMKRKNMMKNVKPWEMEKAIAEEMAKSKNIDKNKRKVAQKMLDDKIFERESMIVDEKIAKELEKEVEYKIKQAIKNGKLKKAKKSDEFIKKQLAWEKKLSE